MASQDNRRKKSNPERQIFEQIKDGTLTNDIKQLSAESIGKIIQNNGTFLHKAIEYYVKSPSLERLTIINRFVKTLVNAQSIPEPIFRGDKNNKNILHYACMNIDSLKEVYKLFKTENQGEFTKLISQPDNTEKRTPLHNALKFLDFEGIKNLKKQIGDETFFTLLSFGDIKGRTPFHNGVSHLTSPDLILALDEFSTNSPSLIVSQTSDGRVCFKQNYFKN